MSAAFDLPVTSAILDEVHNLCNQKGTWANSVGLQEDLQRAYRFLYPAHGGVDGFRPSSTDFFNSLKAYEAVASSYPGGLNDVPQLRRRLRRATAHALIERLRESESVLERRQPYLDKLLSEGNRIITTNWDLLLETYARKHEIPIRHTLDKQRDGGRTTILKLHGSLDWTTRHHSKRDLDTDDYALLKELQNPENRFTHSLTKDSQKVKEIDRIRLPDGLSTAWRRIKSRTNAPFLITMGAGKKSDIGPIESIWRDAYRAVSGAQSLTIVGYSMPEDDTEIRTLLTGGIQRGADPPDKVRVRNPNPPVHNRVRDWVHSDIESVFQKVQPDT